MIPVSRLVADDDTGESPVRGATMLYGMLFPTLLLLADPDLTPDQHRLPITLPKDAITLLDGKGRSELDLCSFRCRAVGSVAG